MFSTFGLDLGQMDLVKRLYKMQTENLSFDYYNIWMKRREIERKLVLKCIWHLMFDHQLMWSEFWIGWKTHYMFYNRMVPISEGISRRCSTCTSCFKVEFLKCIEAYGFHRNKNRIWLTYFHLILVYFIKAFYFAHIFFITAFIHKGWSELSYEIRKHLSFIQMDFNVLFRFVFRILTHAKQNDDD